MGIRWIKSYFRLYGLSCSISRKRAFRGDALSAPVRWIYSKFSVFKSLLENLCHDWVGSFEIDLLQVLKAITIHHRVPIFKRRFLPSDKHRLAPKFQSLIIYQIEWVISTRNRRFWSRLIVITILESQGVFPRISTRQGCHIKAIVLLISETKLAEFPEESQRLKICFYAWPAPLFLRFSMAFSVLSRLGLVFFSSFCFQESYEENSLKDFFFWAVNHSVNPAYKFSKGRD